MVRRGKHSSAFRLTWHAAPVRGVTAGDARSLVQMRLCAHPALAGACSPTRRSQADRVGEQAKDNHQGILFPGGRDGTGCLGLLAVVALARYERECLA